MKKTSFLLLLAIAIGAMEEIPQSAMTIIFVDSEETVGENGAAVNVLDNDPSTIWHTEWYLKEPGYPHEIVFQLDRAYAIENFSYLPRKSQSNGRIKDYQIFISDNPNSWGDPVVQGKWPNQTAQQIVEFPSPVSGRFVKLKALSEVSGNPWASAAEIALNAEFNTQLDIDGWASSLHLGFRDPSGKAAELLMVDIAVDSTSPSTYYAAINFTGGYCGLQDQGSKRTLHFSLWDYVDGDQQTVPENAKAKILWRGYQVSGSAFGGEGTGVKTWRDYPWQVDHPYRLVVKMTPMTIDGTAGSMRDYWVFDFQNREWSHVATLWRGDNPSTGRPETNLGDVYTFVEDWAATSEWFRSCYIFNARKKYWDGSWHIYDRAYYSINDQENNPATPDRHDPNTQAEVRETDKIWLATGGTFIPNQRTSSGTTIRFTPNSDFTPQAPPFSMMKAEPIDDSTLAVYWDYQESLWAAQESYSIQIFQDADLQNLLYSTGTRFPFDDETAARDKDSDRKARFSGLKLEQDKTYYLHLQTQTVFGFSCTNTVPLVNMRAEVLQGQSKRPESLQLHFAYPNPFNAEVVIRYSLATNERVALDIYDTRGVKIRTLYNAAQDAGVHEHRWDARDDAGASAPSGLYVYRLTAGSYSLARKITLLK